MKKIVDDINIADANIMFKNFTGAEQMYNSEGDRNFCVLLDDEAAEQLKEDGWNIKYLKPREEDDLPKPYLKVSLAFKYYPPKVMLITGQGKLFLNEDMCGMLDWIEMEKVNLVIRPYQYKVGGKEGIKAYVRSMYVTVKQDKFESEYYGVPDASQSALVGIATENE